MLACLNQDQLSHTLFPLGEMSKSDARQIAQDQNFINAVLEGTEPLCTIEDAAHSMELIEKLKENAI